MNLTALKTLKVIFDRLLFNLTTNVSLRIFSGKITKLQKNDVKTFSQVIPNLTII